MLQQSNTTCARQQLILDFQSLLMLQNLRHIDLSRREFAPVLLIPFLDVRPRTQWCDGLGIHIVMALGILWSCISICLDFRFQLTDILFDVLEVCRVSELLVVPIHALEPVVQYWVVVAYGTKIAFLPYVRSANSLE
jgi:hypothetical protein